MKFLRCFTILCMAVAAVFLVSCKDKEESSSSKDYLTGTLTFSFPSFVKYGDVIHVEPYGVYKDENKTDSLVAYRWVDPFTGKADTLRYENDPASKGKSFDFAISKDSLATFSMIVSAWADGYYEKTANVTFTVVDPTLGTGSLKGYDFLSSVPSFTDARDGKDYYYNTVAGKDWMIQNLSWDGAGVAYKEAEALSDIFGRYYTWAEASAACPAGWHLPSSADFKALAEAGGTDESLAAGSLMVDATFNGDRMWEFWKDVKITNSSRFSAIPAGYATIDNDVVSFKDYLTRALFWTSDSKNDDVALARYIYMDKPVLFGGEFGKNSIRASVRCIR